MAKDGKHQSDLDSLKEMLTRAKIEFSEGREVADGNQANPDTHTLFTLDVERGYIGFVTTFKFDEGGSLIDMGAYE